MRDSPLKNNLAFSICIILIMLNLVCCTSNPNTIKEDSKLDLAWLQTQCRSPLDSFKLSEIGTMNLKEVHSLFFHQFLDGFPLIIEEDTIKIKESRWISHLFFEFEEHENFVFYSVVSVNQESRTNNLHFITADKETLKPISAVYVASESNSTSGWYFYESKIKRISPTKYLAEMMEHTDETAGEHPPEDAFNGWIITTKNTEISINAQGRFERKTVKTDKKFEPY